MMKKRTKNVLWTVLGIIIALIVIGVAALLIDGRSPQAILVSHALTKSTMEDYEKGKGDMTDKSTVEVPGDVVFPREVRQYRVGNMQVFHMEPQDESKPVVLYIHGGAYLHNFTPHHWAAMAEWAQTTGCGIVTPNYPLLYCYTASDAHPLMVQLYQQLLEQYPGSPWLRSCATIQLPCHATWCSSHPGWMCWEAMIRYRRRTPFSMQKCCVKWVPTGRASWTRATR